MDLNAVTSIARPRRRAEIVPYAEGDAWLAGGTWLFSEPQPGVKRLVDISALGWTPLSVSENGLFIAATCTIAELSAFETPVAWTAGGLIDSCCRSFLASFKIWNVATVGGNLCNALPAGPMISLCAALEGECVIWTPEGAERRLSIYDFVLAPQHTALRPGELLRGVDISRAALVRRTAFRRASLTSLGRSGVLLIGAEAADGEFVLSVTASTRRPIRLGFPELPSRDTLVTLITQMPADLFYDDVHGRPDWRRHMTLEFAVEIRDELAGGRR